MALEDCKTYLGQTTSYVGANGKRLGVLCVLDCSPKMRPAFPRRMKSAFSLTRKVKRRCM